jgi:hypothetical protein
MDKTDGPGDWPPKGLKNEAAKLRHASLRPVVSKLDEMIKALEDARARIKDGASQEVAALTLENLDTSVGNMFESANTALKRVTKQHKSFAKVVDKCMPAKTLPTESDALASHSGYVDRAILLHLLRGGDDAVAKKFINEASELSSLTEMDFGPTSDSTVGGKGPQNGAATAGAQEDSDKDVESELPVLRNARLLQNKFKHMHHMLAELDKHNIEPALEWAKANSATLQTFGSRLEFELEKVHFILRYQAWRDADFGPNEPERLAEVMEIVGGRLARFQPMYTTEFLGLVGALVYAANPDSSPYASLLDAEAALGEVRTLLTHNFNLVMGMAPQPPLVTTVMAGSIALPKLIKYTTFVRAARTEWSTNDELAFDTPLPSSLVYHPIFVCPVLKVQATDKNPPMTLPCGHVICKEALDEICKRSSRPKCPYCPVEGDVNDAVAVSF